MWAGLFFRGSVDPGLTWQNGWLSLSANEAFGMNPIGLEKKLSSSCADLFRATMMNNSRCHETDSRVPVLVVVVIEEAAAEQPAVFDGTKTTRELGAIFQCLELRLGVGIVVGDVRSRVGLRHAEVGQKQGDGLTPHRPATIRVESELAGFDALLATALDHKTASELGTFPVSQHPPRHVAGENVQDHIEVVVAPLDGATQLGDVPRPNLVGAFGQQLRLAVVRTPELVPTFSDLAVRRQNPIHRPDRAVVGSLIQKRGPHFGGRLVDKPLGVQRAEHLVSLRFAKGAVGPRTTLRPRRHRPTAAIRCRASDSQGLTRFRCLSNPSRQLLGRCHQTFSSLSGGFRGIPSNSEAFFWISSIVSTRASRRFSLAFSCSSSLIRGSSAFPFRPRFVDARPTLAISSRWRRHAERSEEYRPSRRRSAATSPSPLQASASRTIRSLYSAVKRRRFARSLTSGSRATRAPSEPVAAAFSTNRLMDDPPSPSTLISRGGVSQGCWHRGEDLAKSLLRTIFGMYVDPRVDAQAKNNIKLFAQAVWEQVGQESKHEIGLRHARYASNADIARRDAAREFLDLVDGLAYLPQSSLTLEMDENIQSLFNAHLGMNNFYNEPPHARNLTRLVPKTGDIPAQLRRSYVKTLIMCRIGNGYGISYAVFCLKKKKNK